MAKWTLPGLKQDESGVLLRGAKEHPSNVSGGGFDWVSDFGVLVGCFSFAQTVAPVAERSVFLRTLVTRSGPDAESASE